MVILRAGFAIKLLLLWLDPTPKLFMGDSWSYIWTSLKGWIPPDRSYFYGYLIRWLAVWSHSFAPLLVMQALASSATAIMFVLICSRFFEMSKSISFVLGLLCALDPLQLVWERYVMTETFSLLFTRWLCIGLWLIYGIDGYGNSQSSRRSPYC